MILYYCIQTHTMRMPVDVPPVPAVQEWDRPQRAQLRTALPPPHPHHRHHTHPSAHKHRGVAHPCMAPPPARLTELCYGPRMCPHRPPHTLVTTTTAQALDSRIRLFKGVSNMIYSEPVCLYPCDCDCVRCVALCGSVCASCAMGGACVGHSKDCLLPLAHAYTQQRTKQLQQESSDMTHRDEAEATRRQVRDI